MQKAFYCNQVVRSVDHHSGIEFLSHYEELELYYGERLSVQPVCAAIHPDAADHFHDILYCTGDKTNLAISARLKSILEENAISGWGVYELTITNSPLKYYGFSVKGRCGELTKPSSPREVVIAVQGFSFDTNTWEGSDFFCPAGTGYLFCTEKVVKLLKRYNIGSTVFVNTQDIRWHYIDWPKIRKMCAVF